MKIEHEIRSRLHAAFAPTWLELDNESHMHSVPAHSETHFRVVMVSDSFRELRAVARHQRVYAELTDLLAGPVHALAMHLYDPQEWSQRSAPAPASPDCRGGSKADGVGGQS